MANENFLGAPTEGLGQTVTFAAGSQGSMSQAGAGQRVQQRDEVQGGFGVNPQRAQHIQERAPDPTMGVLFKMGAEILAPAIKAEQEAGFVRGMQQAAAGQAITDIVTSSRGTPRLLVLPTWLTVRGPIAPLARPTRLALASKLLCPNCVS